MKGALYFGKCVVIVGLTLLQSNVLSQIDYRLPETFSPSYYRINLNLEKDIFNGNQTNFTGSVDINLTPLENSSNIEIHAAVTIETLVLTSGNGSILSANYTYDNITEILSITADSILTIGTNYTLSITFMGKLDLATMRGFYRSEYVNEIGENVFLVATQFQSTYARKAFPCFDEPHYKAKFRINITYPQGLMALGNTPIQQIEAVNSEYEKAVFIETPVMPVYLVAFVVSDLNCTEGNPIDTNVPYSVCSTKESASDRAFALEFGPRIMHALENMTGLRYQDQGLGKMHQVAIPDFAPGGMENWGIVLYKESTLLWNAVASSSLNVNRILTLIAHEFTHSWFGNLVTCDWWDYTFLNEGFARYFQYFTITKLPDIDVDQVWEVSKQFIIEQQQVVFTSDSSTSSNSLSSHSSSPSEVSSKFGDISYMKGASIFRMIENFMGSTNFFAGLNSYLRANSFATTVPNKLWSALQPYIETGAIPLNTTLMEIMENWVNVSGFPLVTVSVSGNNVVLSQRRFLYNLSEADSTQYFVPISYSTSNMSEPFENISPNIWLLPSQTVTLNDVMVHNDWIIVNKQQSGYYRVNYDNILWNRIKAILQSEHEKIHVINRAQIVDDALNLARAGVLNYSETFSILSYLRNETEYFPWYPAIKGFDFLYKIYGEDSEIGLNLTKFEAQLLEGVINSVSFTNTNESNYVYSMKLSMILNRACKLRLQTCITDSNKLFQSFKNGSNIDKNLRSTVYCNGLRYSNDSHNDFLFLWGRYKLEKIAFEKLNIMTALGCSKNITDLKYFLNETLSSNIRVHDFSNAWSAVYMSGPEGLNAALEFFLENHRRIFEYSSSASSLLQNIAQRIIYTDQLNKLENATLAETPLLQSAIASAISTAKANMEWGRTRSSQISQYFESSNEQVPVTPSSTPTDGNMGQSLLPTMILSIIPMIIPLITLGNF